MTGIYKITNKNNGKVYIGQSVDISHRRSCHEYDLKNNRHKNTYLQHAYNKEPDAFTFEVICYCNEDALDELEMFYINKYKATDHKCGYNLDKSARGTGRKSEETKWKMSEVKKGNTAMCGIKLSEEWKKHLSEAQPHKKRVICIDTGEVYESFADAARRTGLNRSKIVSVCTGNRKTTGGLKFRYADSKASD